MCLFVCLFVYLCLFTYVGPKPILPTENFLLTAEDEDKRNKKIKKASHNKPCGKNGQAHHQPPVSLPFLVAAFEVEGPHGALDPLLVHVG